LKGTENQSTAYKPRLLFAVKETPENSPQIAHNNSHKTAERQMTFTEKMKQAANLSQRSPLEAEMDTIPLSFGAHHEQWETMDDIEVIRDSLLCGNISLAMSFLQYRKERGAFQSETVALLLNNSVFQGYRTLGQCIVYQAVCMGDVDGAVNMLYNLGEDVDVCLKKIAFNTTRREVRSNLISYLSKKLLFTAWYTIH